MSSKRYKDYIWNTIGSSAVNFVSLLLLIVVKRINGMDESGIFGFCWTFTILFFMIGLYGGRIYQVSDVRGEFESRTYIFLKFITTAAMLVTSVVFILVNGYDQERAALLISLVVYKILDAVADPLYGVMQRKGKLYYAGISMTLKAVIGFVLFIAVDLVTHNMLWASLCLLAANAVFIAAYDIPHTKSLEKIDSLFSGNMKPGFFLLRTSVYICLFSVFQSLLTSIPRYYVDAYHSDDALAFLNFVIMPATMLNLFVQFVIQPKLVSLSGRFGDAEYTSFNRTVTKLILVSLGFGAIAISAVWLVGCPILSFIFDADLYPYRTSLTLVVLAGTINTVTMIYYNILSVMRRFKIQLICYLIGTASIFAACALLVARDSVDGAVMAFLIANAILAVLFFISYQVIFRKLTR